MGELLEPRTWCRQGWCRTNPDAEHFAGDGCTCHADEAASTLADEAEPGSPDGAPRLEPEPPRLAIAPRTGAQQHVASRAGAHEPRLTILKAKASRLAAFACRACGVHTRRMIEAPAMFFRCEACARDNRWPPSRRQA